MSTPVLLMPLTEYPRSSSGVASTSTIPVTSLGVTPLVSSDKQSADGVADKNIRRREGRDVQQEVQIDHSLFNGIGRRPAVTPGEAGAVVSADPREARRLRLHQRPIDRLK